MKKRGRYQQIDPKKVEERKYTSYEDEPLKESRTTEDAPPNTTKTFIRVFLILFISVVAVLAFINLEKLTPENISHWFEYDLLGKTDGNGYPVRFNGTSVSSGNFSVMDGMPIYCSDTSIVVLNSNAGEYQSSQHSFAAPVLKTNSNYSIVYNADGTGYKIIDREKTLYSGNADYKILDADISSDGTYAVLTRGGDYLSELTVYKNNNKKKYAYSFADYYVNKVSINNSGNMAALSGVTAKNGGLVSAVYILDFTQENYFRKYEFDSSFIYDLSYLDNGKVIAVGNDASYYLDAENNKKDEVYYQMKTLTNYNISRNYGLVLSLSSGSDGRFCDVMAVNADCKTDMSISTANKVLSIDVRNGKVAVLLPTGLNVYDLTGKQLATVNTSTDARKACFSDNSNMYILATSRIGIINIDN